jgi:YVTN family beta-propeller protein
MRRVSAVWIVVLGLLAVGCGTTVVAGDQDARVSAGARPKFAKTEAAGARAPALGGWLSQLGLTTTTTTPPVANTVDDGVPGVGPSLPGTGPTLPNPAGPNVPGDRPSGQPNILAAMTGSLSGAVVDIPTRVYVPNSDAHTLSVIDPNTLEVVTTYATGIVPHHVTPSWDLTKLYVNNTSGNTLNVIDPKTGKVTDTIDVVDPYNLYFTPDGSKAIVVAERLQRLDYRDPKTWELIKSVAIPGSGVDHMDFSADGKYLIASTEFSGHVVKVDNEKMEVAGSMHVGGLPIDVKVSPDGAVFYVTNQGSHGVHVIDPNTMTEIDFLPTAPGAHGLNYSRDTKRLFVSNRLAGSISVIDVATRTVTETWNVGGSPDMLQVSTDGSRLWVSNRFHGSVSVIDTNDGSVVKTIRTGAGAHGVCFFPQPGRFSVGHNGVYR